MKQNFHIAVIPALRKTVVAARKTVLATSLLSAIALAGCASKPPEISYDANMPALPAVPAAVTDDRPKVLHIPPVWRPAHGGNAAATPIARIENANTAARVQPRREGYYNAIQIYPWSEGALYQIYAAPGQITNIALEPGESSDRRRPNRGRRHRPLDHWRHRERQRDY